MYFLGRHDRWAADSADGREGPVTGFQLFCTWAPWGDGQGKRVYIAHLYLLPFSQRARLPQHNAQVQPNREVGTPQDTRFLRAFSHKTSWLLRTDLEAIKPLLMRLRHTAVPHSYFWSYCFQCLSSRENLIPLLLFLKFSKILPLGWLENTPFHSVLWRWFSQSQYKSPGLHTGKKNPEVQHFAYSPCIYRFFVGLSTQSQLHVYVPSPYWLYK